MKISIMNFIFGICTFEVSGAFPERILNIAKENKIFVHHVTKNENKLTFSVSSKGAEMLLAAPLPDTSEVKIISQRGLSHILSSHSSRITLLIAPPLIFLLLFISTQFIWHVNIIDATIEEEKYICEQLNELGVKRGALKASIDQSYVKNRILLTNPDLLWLWVDIRGSSAIVRFARRSLPPEIFTEDDFYNVYSSRDGVITSISPTNGIAKVKVGDTILKGQLLIEGSIVENDTQRRTIHASGTVMANVWEEKIVTIPKRTQIRTPTGRKKEHLSINFNKFSVKLFINSSILYPDYDIIENNRVIAPFNVTFSKRQYNEVLVSYEENDLESLIEKNKTEFFNSLTDGGCKINHTEEVITEYDDYITLTMRVLCEEPVGYERRMNFGENYTITDN